MPLLRTTYRRGLLGLGGLGLSQNVEDVVGPDRFPVPGAHVHADQDVTFLNGAAAAGLPGETACT